MPGAGKNVGIAIVGPSGYAQDDVASGRAIELLQSQGCMVYNYCDPTAKHHRFAAIDKVRVEQLHAAAADPRADIVLALRGGYGMSRLLHMIDFDLLASSGKRFVGHSDFTALQMGLLAKSGVVSFAGPMVCADFSREDLSSFMMEHFWQCLSNRAHTIEFQPDRNPEIALEGILWGGNLTMLAHLVGTPYLPRVDGGILFIEDVNEHPYRVERMLLQLFHAGVLSTQKAIVLGDFSNYQLSAYDNGYDFAAMLDYFRTQVGIPVLTGLPFGHIRDKVTLPVGAHARLVSTGMNTHMTVAGYPVLASTTASR